MTISAYYLIPPLPEGLEGLAEVGLDLRWSWSHATDPLWERLDPELWNLTRNPWLILQSVSFARLETLARDADFRNQVDEQVKAHRQNLEAIQLVFRSPCRRTIDRRVFQHGVRAE